MDAAADHDADEEERRAIQEYDGDGPEVAAPKPPAPPDRCARCGLGALPNHSLHRFASGRLEHDICPPPAKREALRKAAAAGLETRL